MHPSLNTLINNLKYDVISTQAVFADTPTGVIYSQTEEGR